MVETKDIIKHYPPFDVSDPRIPDINDAVLAAGSVRPRGASCPCCSQHVQVYRRQIYRKMAGCLYWLLREYQKRTNDGELNVWVDIRELSHFRGGDNVKLRYWHLIAAHPTMPNLYAPTYIGKLFVTAGLAIPKYAYVYNGEVLGFSSELTTFVEARGLAFSREELELTGSFDG